MRRTAAAGLLVIMTMACASAPHRLAAAAHVDHIMLGVRDLEEGIAEFQRLTSVTPRRGGRHPGRGTENALVSLGDNTYLEIIAPQREGTDDESFLADLRALPHLTPVGWAVGVNDVAAMRSRLARAGMKPSDPAEGSRRTPTGEVLRWVTFGVEGSDASPFFIRWDPSTVHPSRSAPGGCALRTLALADPEAAAITHLLAAAGMPMPVRPSARTEIEVTLTCNSRDVTFRRP